MASQVEQMQREIQSLTDKLAAAKIGGRATPKKKKAGPSSGFQSGLMVNNAGSSGKRRRRKRSGPAVSNVGTITFARVEKVCDITAGDSGSGAGNFPLWPSSFTFLSKFKMFDKVRWNKVRLFYKPGVGAMTNGFVSYGALWDFSANTANRAQISALTPNMSHAVWFDGQSNPLVLPVSKLQTRPWFSPDYNEVIEAGPGKILWCVEAVSKGVALVGELWADYSITMTGTSF